MVLLNKIAAGLAASTALVHATADSCNPLKSSECSPNAALGSSFAEDFSSEPKRFKKSGNPTGEIEYSSDGMKMTINKRFDNPILKSDFYLMFGKVEVEFKAAAGQGIISSFYLQSDDLDEIDLEWTGGDTTEFQTNYFSKGNTTTWDRGAFHGVYTPQEKFHTYTIDWTKEKTDFLLDGALVRSLASDASGGYPQSPMYLIMGCWAGGDPDNQPGTIEWAGGLTDYTKAPFSMYIKRVIVTDYSSGEEYSYSDQSGSWESIKAKNGEVYGRYEQAQSEFSALTEGKSISVSSKASSSTASSSSTSSSKTSSTTSSKASSTSSSSAVSSSVSTTASNSTAASSTAASTSLISSSSQHSNISTASTTSTRSSSASISSISSKASSTAARSTTLSSVHSSVHSSAHSSSSSAAPASSSSHVASSISTQASSSTISLTVQTDSGARALEIALSPLVAALAILI